MTTIDAAVTGPTVPVLIKADELHRTLTDGPADRRPTPVLLDVRWNLGGPPGRPEYEAGHLPSARFVDLETELSGPQPDRSAAGEPAPARSGGRHPLPASSDFESAMRRAGVDPDSAVVVYDAATSLAAARLWWMLTDAGHPDVRVLDGGYAAWRAAGFETDTGPGAPVATGRFTAHPGHRRAWSGDELAARIAAGDPVALVDVRGYERFTGEVEPVDPVAGHLPGAVSAPSTDNLEPDGRFGPRERIRERYADLDARAGADGPVFYCGSGITAAHTLLARTAAGLTTGTIYPGSWSDWISDPDRPRTTGAGPRF